MAGDHLRIVLHYIIYGLQDALLGIFKIYHMDQEQLAERKRSTMTDKSHQEHTSTLARRRIDKTKPIDTRPKQEPRVLHRIILCCAWNGGVFWLSILAFNGVLLPCLHAVTHIIFGGSSTHSIVWGWLSPVMTFTFSALWILPLFVLSKIVNCLWFQDIADAAYRRSRGRPQMLPSISRIIADTLFSLLIQSLFLIQCMLASLLPIPGVGQMISIIHMCLLYSLYSFEYKWFNMGWEVNRRLSYIECNWPYFVGFGLPLAVVTSLPSSFIVSGCVFSILFPLFIISGNEAERIPETFDYPLRLFSPVVHLSDAIFRNFLKKSHEICAASSGTPVKSSHVH